MSMDVGSKKVKSDINVTPLVDVVLVLLIIFMVITPLLQRGKAVQLPDARYVSELKKGDPILLSVTRDGKVWFDKEEVPKKEIAQQLELHMQMLPGAPVLVKVDRDVPYKTVREVVLEISKTHILGVSLAATQLKEK